MQTLTTLHACASSMMDGGEDNFEAAQYPGRYSNFMLDDILLNLMDKMNYCVPLIVHPCHLKGKTLCRTGHLKLNSAPAPAETGDLKGLALRSGRMWSQNIVMHHFGFSLRERGTFTSSLEYLVQTWSDNASLPTNTPAQHPRFSWVCSSANFYARLPNCSFYYG